MPQLRYMEWHYLFPFPDIHLKCIALHPTQNADSERNFMQVTHTFFSNSAFFWTSILNQELWLNSKVTAMHRHGLQGNILSCVCDHSGEHMKLFFVLFCFFSLRETHWGECHTPDVGGACAWPPLIWSISSMNTNPQHKERPINTSGSTWEIWFFSTSTCVWASSWSSWDCVASMLVPAKCLCAPWVWEECTLQKKIEMKLKGLILSFIPRHKSHIISILNALQQSCFWSACLL